MMSLKAYHSRTLKDFPYKGRTNAVGLEYPFWRQGKRLKFALPTAGNIVIISVLCATAT